MSALVFLFNKIEKYMRRSIEREPIRSRREILEERGYKKFELRDRETGEIDYVCWAKTRRNAVRQRRYHQNKNKHDDLQN